MSTTMYSEIMRLKPLCYYPLADAVGSASVKDASGNALNGTVTGAVTFGQAALLKASVLTSAAWTGTSDAYVTIPSITLPTIWTYAVWCNLAGAGTVGGTTYGDLFHASTTYPLLAVSNTGHILMEANAGVDVIFSTGAIALNTASFVVAVFNGTTLSFYLNGVFDSSFTMSAAVAGAFTFDFGSFIGGYVWNGKQAQHAFFNAALTADQIAWLYKVGRGAGVLQGNHRAFGRIG